MPRRLALLLALFFCTGCAAAGRPQLDNDPWEGMNRGIFWFNDTLDVYALEPAAQGWEFITPQRLRTSLDSFFGNLNFPTHFVNSLLQGKAHDGGVSLTRFMINTTVGVAGFFDPASTMGLPKVNEDFGQTLGVWGFANGPYLVLPVFGPSTIRDTVGLGGDYATGMATAFVDFYYSAAARVVATVNFRSLILKEVAEAKRASLDYYTFVRNAYLQRRDAMVRDVSGQPEKPAKGTNEASDDLYVVDPDEAD